MTIMLSLIAGLQAMEIENTNVGNCAPEVASKFLTEVVTDNYVKHDFIQFIENVLDLKEVCHDWNQIIDNEFMHQAMVLGCQQLCPNFLNGKLIYRSNQTSDEGMIELKISDLWNPLGGRFNLSQCGNAIQYLSISSGYRKEMKAENSDKVEIWFTPRFLVEKELNSTAGHFKSILPSKWNDDASVGMFWTWGNWEKLEWYDYLTSESIDNLSKINLFENWKKSALTEVFCGVLVSAGRWGGVRGVARFHVSFVS